MIGTKFYKPLLDDGALDKDGNPSQNTYKHYAEAAQWCNENKATIEDVGEYYEVVAIPEPSDTEKLVMLKGQLEQAVQHHLDTGAQQLDYDNCLTVCSYANCGVEKYEIEAAAFVRWRAACWDVFYPVWNKIVDKTIEVPTTEQIVKMLPKLTIQYPDGSTFEF